MASVVKKIVFYEIIIPKNKGVSGYKYLYDVFKIINSTDEDAVLNLPSSKADVFTRMVYKEENFNSAIQFFEGKLYSVKDGDFPATYKASTATTQDLDEFAAEDENVYEETHFVIDAKPKSKNENPIIGLELNRGGASASTLKLFLEKIGKSRPLSYDFDIYIEPIFGQRAEEFVKAMVECASFELKIRYSNINNVKAYSEELYSAIKASQTIAATDYVQITVGYDFKIKSAQRRSDTNPLIELVKKIVGINIEKPGFFDNFDTLEVRGRESVDGKLKLFDLIEDRTAEEVLVQKRKRTKYVESQPFLKEIRNAIRENFG